MKKLFEYIKNGFLFLLVLAVVVFMIYTFLDEWGLTTKEGIIDVIIGIGVLAITAGSYFLCKKVFNSEAKADVVALVILLILCIILY